MKIFRMVIATVAAAAALFSWGEETAAAKGDKKPGVYYGDGETPIESLPEDAVLVSVNGVNFTRKDFDLSQEVSARCSVFSLGLRLDESRKLLNQSKEIRKSKALNIFVRRELLNQEFHRRGGKVLPAAADYSVKRLMGLLHAKPGSTYEDIAAWMGDKEIGDYFLKLQKQDAENLSLVWEVAGTNLDVSAEEIVAASNRIAQANEIVAATNGFLMAKLADARARVLAGEDFETVGKGVSMIERGDAKEWGVFSIDSFDNDDRTGVADWLSSEPGAGDISDLIETDDGISVIKVMEVLPPTEAERGKTRYRLARMTIGEYETYEIPSAEQLKTDLENKKRKDFELVYGTRLFNEAVIEFPNGTNLFSKAKARVKTKGRNK